jgi:hypothetical protein
MRGVRHSRQGRNKQVLRAQVLPHFLSGEKRKNLSESWQTAVAAARKRNKSLFWVEHGAGGTLDVFLTQEAALKCRAEQSRPALYRVFEQRPDGSLYEINE